VKRFLGRRARFPSEVCPSCSDPGVGMVLEINDAQDAVPRWICSKCCRAEETCLSAPVEVVPRLSHDESIHKGLPVWLHIACDRCVFLGTWHRDPKAPIDCYWCPNELYPSISSVLGRYGDIGQEYMSMNPPEAYSGGRAAHLPVADGGTSSRSSARTSLDSTDTASESSAAEPFWAERAGCSGVGRVQARARG
jgi:hypothetical protein